MSFGRKRECSLLREKLAVKNWELERAVSKYNSLIKQLDYLNNDILQRVNENLKDYSYFEYYIVRAIDPLPAAFTQGVKHGVALTYSHFALFIEDLRNAANDG